jgi:1-acyl-sn-glycerol-3-phosphate acyltransferase
MHYKLTYFVRNLFWQINLPFVGLFIKTRYNFSLEADSDRIPTRPYVIVANHATFLDPWIVGYHSPAPLAIMMNDDGFRSKPLTLWYLKNIGAFPKKKGAHDFKAMKMTIQFLRNRFPVLIFPEGQTTWDGETQPIYRGIEKIIKKTGCHLVIMRLRGNFLTKPWWADTTRKGQVKVKITTLAPERIATMSDNELLETIKTSIYNNDIKNPANNSTGFSGHDCALGLERFVWICMECGSEDALTTHGDIIQCSACNNSWRIDAGCRLTTENNSTRCLADLKDWSEWHKQKVKDKLTTTVGSAIVTSSNAVMMQTEDDAHRFVDRSSGRLDLTRDTLCFTPETGPAIRFALTEIADFVFQRKNIFEFLHGDKTCRFVFTGHSPMKWVYYLRYLSGYEECEKRGIL